MRIGGSELGGLSGGLYGTFETFGRLFFTVLIGGDRANQHGLEYTAVTAGSLVFGLSTGTIIWISAATRGWDFGPPIIWFPLALILWLVLAQIAIGYVKGLRAEEVKGSPQRDFTRPFDQIVLEKQREFEERGYSKRDAEREAYWFASAKGECFVATAVYRDLNAPELTVLRTFRERSLRRYRLGRLSLAVYEYLGPIAAMPVGRVSLLRRGLKAIINTLVKELARRGYSA